MNYYLKLFTNPKMLTESILRNTTSLWSDKMYIRLLYRIKLGKWPNLSNPSRFTEKLQWLKLNYRIPLLTQCVDKYLVKQYVEYTIGKEYIIKDFGAWDQFSDIDFNSLPSRFVLKTTNGGGSMGVIICKDKNVFNKVEAEKKLTKSLTSNIYNILKEWPYKNVKPRIIAEEFLEDEFGELRDYKFYCFNGMPKVLLVASNRFTTHNFNYMDMDFNQLPIISTDGKPTDEPLEKPKSFEEMKSVVEKLSKPFPHVRVDMYSCHDKIYFGELTFFDSSGFDNMTSDEWDLKFGSWLTLPEKCVEK